MSLAGIPDGLREASKAEKEDSSGQVGLKSYSWKQGSPECLHWKNDAESRSEKKKQYAVPKSEVDLRLSKVGPASGWSSVSAATGWADAGEVKTLGKHMWRQFRET